MHATAARPSVPRGANPRTTITAIDALIARMMAPRPEDRFASYDELLRAVELASVAHTRPAGFWVRSIATGVDLALAALALGVMQVARELAGMGPVDIAMDQFGLVLAAVYRAFAIQRWGTTAGKALLELEVVSVATSQRPTLGQALRRELLLVVVPVTFAWLEYTVARLALPVPADLLTGLGVAGAVTFIALLLHAALRVPGKRAPWDRLSGTLVRYRTTRGSTSTVS